MISMSHFLKIILGSFMVRTPPPSKEGEREDKVGPQDFVPPKVGPQEFVPPKAKSDKKSQS